MKTPKPILDVLANRPPSRRPIWLMRQAGRYLPEYRDVRAKAGSFLDLCYDPQLACEVTLQPLRRFDLDAAILFSDILVVPQAMGLKLAFVENEGPLLQTVRSAEEVGALRVDGNLDPFIRVAETVSLVAQSLMPGKALIGFCGAPWTVASYMIEGGSSNRALAIATAQAAPDWFTGLMAKLVEASILYLRQQIAAGVEVIQIFDSWAGDLPVQLRQRFVADPIAAIVRGVRAAHPDFPVIVFARGIGSGHAGIAGATAATAVGIEQGYSLADALASLPASVAVQGNLDPVILRDGGRRLEVAVADICKAVPPERHIFNLGHGILPQTPPEHVARLLDLVGR